MIITYYDLFAMLYWLLGIFTTFYFIYMLDYEIVKCKNQHIKRKKTNRPTQGQA